MRRHTAIATLLVAATFAIPSAQCAPAESADSVIVLTPMRDWRGTTVVVELESAWLGTESPTALVADLRRSGTASRYAREFASPKYARLYSSLDQKDSARPRLEDDDPERLLANSIVLDFEDEEQTSRAIMTLLRHPAVKRVSRSAIGNYSADPLLGVVSNQPQQYEQWLHRTNVVQGPDLTGVWGRTRGNAYVGVLDNGILTNGGVHPDLAPAFRSQFSRNFGYPFNGVNGTATGTSAANVDELPWLTSTSSNIYVGHGTHVAGLIAAGADNYQVAGDRRQGTGTCPRCSLAVGRVSQAFHQASGGGVDYYAYGPNFAAVGSGISSMMETGIQVLSISLGDPERTSSNEPALHAALQAAAARDIVVVTAAGNFGTPVLQYPASDAGNVVPVGGVNWGGDFWFGAWSDELQQHFGSSWSTSSTHQHFVAAATDVISTIYSDYDYFPSNPVACGEMFPGNIGPGWGNCNGTSQCPRQSWQASFR